MNKIFNILRQLFLPKRFSKIDKRLAIILYLSLLAFALFFLALVMGNMILGIAFLSLFGFFLTLEGLYGVIHGRSFNPKHPEILRGWNGLIYNGIYLCIGLFVLYQTIKPLYKHLW